MGFWKRIERGLTRKELSAKSGVPMSTVNRAIERDSQPFAIDALRISKALNVSLEYLLDLPELKNDKKASAEDESHQIELFKKYHSTIEALEDLSKDKQKEVVAIVKQILEFRK